MFMVGYEEKTGKVVVISNERGHKLPGLSYMMVDELPPVDRAGDVYRLDGRVATPPDVDKRVNFIDMMEDRDDLYVEDGRLVSRPATPHIVRDL